MRLKGISADRSLEATERNEWQALGLTPITQESWGRNP